MGGQQIFAVRLFGDFVHKNSSFYLLSNSQLTSPKLLSV